MIKINIISGFLGAGKTTLIKKLLTAVKGEKIILLENEYGDVGVDGAFMKDSGRGLSPSWRTIWGVSSMERVSGYEPLDRGSTPLRPTKKSI